MNEQTEPGKEAARILIVDDDRSTRRTLAMIFNRKGYATTVADSGREALEIAARETFNLALLDIKLPDMPGVALIGPLISGSPDIMVMMVTGHASLETSMQALNEGAAAYITKPLDMDQVLSKVQQALEQQALRAENRRLFSQLDQELQERRKAELSLKEANAELEQANRELIVLNELGTLVASSLDSREIFRIIYRQAIAPLVEVDRFSVTRFDPEAETLECEFVISGGQEQDPGSLPLGPLASELVRHHMRTREPAILAPETLQPLIDAGEPLAALEGAAAMAICCIPLFTGSRIIGIIGMASRNQHQFDELDLALLTTIGSQAAVTLENAHLFERVQAELSWREKIEAVQRLQSTALEASANAIMITDADGIILSVNPAFTEMTGYSAEEVAGRIPSTILGAANRNEATLQELSETLRSGDTWKGRMINRRKDGTEYIDEQTITPVRDQNGKISHFISVREDVSEKVRAEAEIRQRNQELRRLYRTSANLFSASAPKLNVLGQTIVETLEREFTECICSLFLVAADESGELTRISSAGADVDNDQHVQMNLEGIGLVAKAIRSAAVLNVPALSADPDYLPHWPEARSALITPLLVGGEVIGAIDLQSPAEDAFDENDRRLMSVFAERAALALENARLFSDAEKKTAKLELLGKMSASVSRARTESEMLPVIVNSTMELLQGISATIVMPLPGTDKLIVRLGIGEWTNDTGQIVDGSDSLSARLMRGELEHYITDDVPGDRLRHHYTPTSQTPFAAGVPLVTAEGPVGALWLGSEVRFTPERMTLLNAVADIAASGIQRAGLFERTLGQAVELEHRVRERTAQLTRTNEELVRAARVKDDFLASMSHELRTPLNAILLRTEIMQKEIQGTLTPKQADSLGVIAESGKHLLSLINDILDLAKLDAGKITLKRQNVSVIAICNASIILVNEMAQVKDISLGLTMDHSDVLLMADERRLKQMLVNLLSNAIKFTHEGGQVGLDVVVDEGEQAIFFTVWDTGIGIAEKDLPRLFRPFEQLESGLDRKFGGTGLGLALTERLTKMHRGEVSVQSEVGRGSRFTVTLPWETESGDGGVRKQTGPLTLTHGKLPPPPSVPEPPAERQPQARQITILLAEDNKLTAMGVIEYLESRDVAAVVAVNGADAVAKAGELMPDLILMDVQMPGMDGIEATRRIRSDSRLAGIPIVALTAMAMPGDKERLAEAGVDGYLSKPITLGQLDEAIETFVKKAAG